MPAYRIVYNSSEGKVLDLLHFNAASDEAAILHAHQLYGGAPDRGYEVWNHQGVIFKAVSQDGK